METIGKIVQLKEKPYQHAPFDQEERNLAEHARTKLKVLITSILMEDKEKHSKMWDKSDKIIDAIIGELE